VTQIGAIFLEAYRNLNSKKLFWIVLVMSVLVVGSFAAVGINEDGIKIAFWQFDDPFALNSNVISPAEFYKALFVHFGIGFWLSWIAAILALVSTAGIFVDLMTSGSIDLVVSKPIGRLRLFVTQYAAALLFVTLQVTVFTVVSFLVLGIRGGAWEPGLFLAVPVVVCFFSYLYSVCVLLGIVTRSTVAALLLTILFWLGLSLLSTAEQTLLMFDTMDRQGVSLIDLDNGQRGRESKPEDSPDDGGSDDSETPKDKNSRWLSRTHDVVYGIKTVLPKTDETIGLLERWLIDLANLEDRPGDDRPDAAKNVQKELVETIRGRSVAWVVGTSLGFELVILSLAALIFCRRDY
jgi:ABC-type transport system involved in multi-copper enzyme maturation permease subunit